MGPAVPDATSLLEALRAAGVVVGAADLVWEERDERRLARLPGGRLLWFPANPNGRQRLERERRVLRLIAGHCSFGAPRVLFESPEGWDVRSMVPGDSNVWGLYQRVLADSAFAARIGSAIGAILVEQHTQIRETEITGWLPTAPDWPEPSDGLRQALTRTVDDDGLLADIDRVLARYDGTAITSADRVLVHGDLGLHNMAIDAATASVAGVFDYDGACWADRHHDFRYLVFDAGADALLDAALAAYEPAVGVTLDRARIHLYNAACAIGFLAHRGDAAPGARPAGRTLEEDLRWVRGALARL